MRHIILGILLLITTQALAGDVDPSGYSLYSGGEFYVLTDGVFGTDQNITVRFESANTTLSNYGGVDVRLYRIPKPLDFLKSQKNLHRPSVKGSYFGEGLSNVVTYLWDSWYKKARLAWQRVFSSASREKATTAAPALVQTPPNTYKTQFTNNPQFGILKGFDLVDSFRYPVWIAQPNKPTKETTMEGSSSNFLETRGANVLIPLGKRAPGLYLVEAMIGSFRATTLVFVSDTIVVTKVSSQQGFVWTVNRQTGLASGKAKVMLTDGVGTLDRGDANDDGVYISKRSIPEHSFAMVEDAKGGVAISENFFYDSEVYQPKIFVFTDRPLYQPGDTVYVRAFGRNIERSGARDRWSPLPQKPANVTVVDATGVSLLSQKVEWQGANGGEAQFKLPDVAESGGYTLKFSYDKEDYGAAFRVARFTKPHFDVQINFAKAAYKVGEDVKGTVSLTYPSGAPVAGAEINLQLRSEQMSMFEGSYSYAGEVPVELSAKTYKSNAKGVVRFTLPAAKRPSRYIASVRAMDKAAYRVTAKKEALIEGYLETYILKSEFSATQPGTPVKVIYERQGADAGADMSQQLRTWQAIRLEDRTTAFGKITGGDRGEFTMTLDKQGHYVVRVVDVNGIARGTRSFVVLGPDLKSTSGEVEILADKDDYAIGETARVLLTFPQKTDDALITLERNDVSDYGRLTKGASWFAVKRLSPTQWQLDIKIKDEFAPNMILSAAYIRAGDFGFENKGLIVKKPTISVAFKANKQTYSPGEKVDVEIETTLEGKGIQSVVAMSVVDEMIYVLQPEIAPPIGDFFHHLRRNQVRTTSSSQFYSFNPGTSSIVAPTPAVENRDLKLMTERARRDTRDLAYWNGSLKTDSSGKAKFSFTMPDALTRWRMTARAMAVAEGQMGVVGESKGFVLSNKDYYLTWTGPKRFRQGDKPRPAMVVFNTTKKDQTAEIALRGPDYTFTKQVKLEPGTTVVTLDKAPEKSGAVEAKLSVDGKAVDLLETSLDFISAKWQNPDSMSVSLEKASPLKLPAGATNVQVKIVSESAYQFSRIADDLLEYPWGCVEQISSRLIPLTMATRSLEAVDGQTPETIKLRDEVAGARRRLISMAGPDAVFTWWGWATSSSASLMMTTHAYHADWRASKLLGVPIEKKDWEHLLDVYSKATGSQRLERAYALWTLQMFGLPVKEQLTALMTELSKESKLPSKLKADESAAIDAESDDTPLATVLAADVALASGLKLTPAWQARVSQIAAKAPPIPLYQSAILLFDSMLKKPGIAERANQILATVKVDTPTFDRAMTLAFVEQALPQAPMIRKSIGRIDLGKGWTRATGAVPTFTPNGGQITADLPKIAGSVASVSYLSPEEPKSTLKATVLRQLYRVNFNSASTKPSNDEDDADSSQMEIEVVAVKDGAALDPNALYIDDLTVNASEGSMMLLEVPLPPGGEVDQTTWGLAFKGVETNFVEHHSSSQGLGYSIAVPASGQAHFSELVRFSSRGQFTLPPARLFRMYRPSSHAYEGAAARHAFNVQ